MKGQLEAALELLEMAYTESEFQAMETTGTDTVFALMRMIRIGQAIESVRAALLAKPSSREG